MDQRTLVIEQIDAGRKFLAQLDKYLPVVAAFWLKASTEGSWYLFVASEKFNDGPVGEFYGDVSRAVQEVNDPHLNQFRVNLIGTDDPRTRAALDIHRRFAEGIPAHFRDCQFGRESVEEVYVYPPPYKAEEERWRGISVLVFPEQQPQGAYYVEFWPRVPMAMVWPGGPPKRVPRPAGVRVEGEKVIEGSFRPPEKSWPHLSQRDYEQKAVEAVRQVAAKDE